MKESFFGSLRNALIGIAVLFLVLSAFWFYKGYDVKNNYYNSDYAILNNNAYVGGDAYNFIINGTYFIGYNVAGMGCVICAVICGMGAAMLTAKEEGLLYLDRMNSTLQEISQKTSLDNISKDILESTAEPLPENPSEASQEADSEEMT